MTKSGTTSDNELYNEWQRVTTNYSEWQPMKTSDNQWQWVTASDTMGDNEWDNKWQGVVQRMKMNESEWEQAKESDFGFYNCNTFSNIDYL